eukprot:scaffold17948_cov37-Cyclotella_meneghiniana.AAC.4
MGRSGEATRDWGERISLRTPPSVDKSPIYRREGRPLLLLSYEKMKSNLRQEKKIDRFQPQSVTWLNGFRFLRRGESGDGRAMMTNAPQQDDDGRKTCLMDAYDAWVKGEGYEECIEKLLSDSDKDDHEVHWKSTAYRVPRTAKVPRIRGTRGTCGTFAVISRYFRGIFSFRGTFAVNLTYSRYIRGTFAYTFGIKSLNNNTEELDDVVHNVSRLFNTRQYNMFKAVKNHKSSMMMSSHHTFNLYFIKTTKVSKGGGFKQKYQPKNMDSYLEKKIGKNR